MALPQGGPQTAGQTGGIINTGSIVTNGGHVIGGDVTINSPEAVVDALEARGLLQAAENAGLQRRVIVMLAQRLKPAERLDFERAITELNVRLKSRSTLSRTVSAGAMRARSSTLCSPKLPKRPATVI